MFFKDNRVTYGVRLSNHIFQDNNGQLICNDCIIARTGTYEYLESEIKDGGDPNKVVKVYRTDEEVFSPEAMASCEDKPLVDDHPNEDVTPSNHQYLQKGYTKNVRRGTGEYSNCVMCDVVVFDPETIELIKSGKKRELSLGYDSVVRQDKNGKYYMTNIRVNHLALVDEGRAGCAHIRDKKFFGGNKMKFFDDDDVKEVTDDDDVVVEEVEPAPEEEITDDDIAVEETETAEPTNTEIYALLQEIKSMLESMGQAPTTDEDTIADDDIQVEEVADDDVIVEETEDCDNTVKDEEFEVLDADADKKKAVKDTYRKFAKIGVNDSKAKTDAENQEKMASKWQEMSDKLLHKN